MNYIIDLAHSLCGLVVRALGHGIQRSEVRFLTGTQKTSFLIYINVNVSNKLTNEL